MSLFAVLATSIAEFFERHRKEIADPFFFEALFSGRLLLLQLSLGLVKIEREVRRVASSLGSACGFLFVGRKTVQTRTQKRTKPRTFGVVSAEEILFKSHAQKTIA